MAGAASVNPFWAAMKTVLKPSLLAIPRMKEIMAPEPGIKLIIAPRIPPPARVIPNDGHVGYEDCISRNNRCGHPKIQNRLCY